MESPKNLNDLLIEKKNNFCDYLISLFPDNESVKKNVNTQRSVDNSSFLLYVKNNIQPYKENLDYIVDDRFETYLKNSKKLEEKDRVKIKRYLSFFIDLC